MAESIDAQSLPERRSLRLGLAAIFTATIFLSATLLFSVQPMFTKLILPLLGGASNVWNTAMVFFQAMLLAGYVYAHVSTKYLPLKAQIGLHFAVTLIGLAFLPLAIGDVTVPGSEMPTLWLLGLFAATVGAPFFALSANAPLLQRWFSLTDHRDAQDPYFLYSASNAGSLIILCAYPIAIEPTLRLGEQTALWTLGYVLLLGMIGLTAWVGVRRRRVASSAKPVVNLPTGALTARTIAFWILLAFIPSSLMLGVTSHMTNNIASAPFLWIIPLALYLLTFVIVFARKPIVSSAKLGPFIPWVVLGTLAMISIRWPFRFIIIGTCLASFFVIALYCHARLTEARPDASRLTLFYIVMSIGGVLGGLFNALIAPSIFVTTLEYPLVLLIAAFIVPAGVTLMTATLKAWCLCGLGLIGALVAWILMVKSGAPPIFVMVTCGLIVFAATMPLNIRRSRSLILLSVLMITPFVHLFTGGDVIYRDRSFFSTLSVELEMTDLGLMHSFVHGDTIHNFQLRDTDYKKMPAAYYAPDGSFDLALQAARKISDNLSVAAVGLGAGALSCYERPGDNWTYFEIDPAVIKMAKNPDLFSYLTECSPNANILVGDARQRLMDLPAASQDIIIVDAFSSDSIPAHLVTREALALYTSRLKPTGLIFFHTSNRMMDVSSVVARLATDAGLESRYISRKFDKEIFPFASNSKGLLVGVRQSLETATAGEDLVWTRWVPSQRVGVWTDDYTSVIGTIRALWLKDGHSEPIQVK